MISDRKLKVCFRNFFRNKMVNLSATSIKHFLPNADISCVTMYKNDEDEYNNQPPLHDYITEFMMPTKYVNKSKNVTYDHVDNTKTSGYSNPDNGLFFTEGLNVIYNLYKNCDEIVLALAEDHFFTTGATIRELVDNDYDVAFASAGMVWNNPNFANASILAFNPKKVQHAFPLPEVQGWIEHLLGYCLIDKIPPPRLYSIQNRKWVSTEPGPNYCGDGIWTNSSEVMEKAMKEAGII